MDELLVMALINSHKCIEDRVITDLCHYSFHNYCSVYYLVIIFFQLW